MLYQSQSFHENRKDSGDLFTPLSFFGVIISIRIVMSRETPTDAAIDPLLSAMFLT